MQAWYKLREGRFCIGSAEGEQGKAQLGGGGGIQAKGGSRTGAVSMGLCGLIPESRLAISNARQGFCCWRGRGRES